MRTAIVLLLSVTLLGCGDSPSPAPHDHHVTLRGVVLEKSGDIENPEVWEAAASPYYVLDVGDQQLERRTAAEGVILRGSAAVADFKPHVGKTVEVVGHYMDSRPYTPSDDATESFPVGLDGKPLPRGGGFLVEQLSVVE